MKYVWFVLDHKGRCIARSYSRDFLFVMMEILGISPYNAAIGRKAV